MELELKQETRQVMEPLGEWTLAQEETAETIVPDYCPDAARIIETGAAAFVHSREVRDGQARVSGTVRVNVLYIPDGEGGVRALEFDLPFTAEGESHGCPDDTLLWAEAEPEFTETRLLNPRKLFTRCKLAVRLAPYRKADLVYSSDAASGDGMGLEKRIERRHAVLLTQTPEREFTFSDELELSPGRPGAAELLSWRVTPSVTEAKVLGNKLMAKGIFTVSLLYLTEEGADDLVMMSRTAFERMADRFRLYALLEEGMEDVRAGRVIPAREAFDSLLADMDNGTI